MLYVTVLPGQNKRDTLIRSDTDRQIDRIANVSLEPHTSDCLLVYNHFVFILYHQHTSGPFKRRCQKIIAKPIGLLLHCIFFSVYVGYMFFLTV